MPPHDSATVRKLRPLDEQNAAPSPALLKDVEALQYAERRMAELLNDPAEQEQVSAPRPGQRERQDVAYALRWFRAVDALALFSGLILAWVVTLAFNLLFDKPIEPLIADEAIRVAQFMAIAAGVILWFENSGHYRVRMPFWIEIKKIVGTLAFATMIDGFLVFASKQDFSRLSLICGWAFAAVGIIVLRNAYRRLLIKQGRWQVSTLLVGTGIMAEEAQAALESEASLGYVVTAQIEDLPQAFMRAGRNWENLCAEYGADYVLIALGGAELARADQPLQQLSREAVPFTVASPLRHIPVVGMMPQYFFNHDVMMLSRACGLQQPLQQAMKRGFDMLAAGGTILALSPLFLILAALVKMDGGKIFYGQPRLGLKGSSFPCLKFRSMVENGDEVLKKHLAENEEARAEWEVYRKLKKDPRVTRVGAFLRKNSLDELPQLLNVLRGDMTLVGPRPILASEIDLYDHDIVHYYRVRPGITGMWQVSGRNTTSYAQRVQMDSWYVRNWSVWHDVAIICKTFPVLLKRTGAY